MLKLTRLNNNTVAINPDHIAWVDSNPDTTLCLIGGEKIIVRESLDELIGAVVLFRRACRMTEPGDTALGTYEGDPPRYFAPPRRSSLPPSSYRGGR
ncbi:MAG TPA: flagellar FlbD family protein [Polyangiaceae bacterium]